MKGVSQDQNTLELKKGNSNLDLSFTVYLLLSVTVKSNVRSFTTRGNSNFVSRI